MSPVPLIKRFYVSGHEPRQCYDALETREYLRRFVGEMALKIEKHNDAHIDEVALKEKLSDLVTKFDL